MADEPGLMNFNSSDDFNFEKLTKVAPGSIEAKLYQIIDDIDTASDMFKENLKGFQAYTLRHIKEAQELIISDGYELYYNELARNKKNNQAIPQRPE